MDNEDKLSFAIGALVALTLFSLTLMLLAVTASIVVKIVSGCP